MYIEAQTEAATSTMSFPPRSQKEQKESKARWVKWQDWCKEHADLIIASGLPSETILDEGHWQGFLEISYRYPAGFEPDRLSVPQKIALLRLIATRPIDLRTPIAVSLIKSMLDTLERRL